MKVGAVMLRTDATLGLTGRHVTSSILPVSGFELAFPHLEDALQDVLGAEQGT